MNFKHYSVMLNECIEGLNIKEGGIFYDGTFGGGGHSSEILNRAKNIKVVGVDRDIDALNNAKTKFNDERLILVHDNFKNVKSILKTLDIESIDGAILDLGVSSYQLDNFERGFSYRSEDANLDMRMNQAEGQSAYDIVNNYPLEKLTKIFFEFGEEKFSKKIANNIVNHRSISPIKTCGDLTEIIKSCVPHNFKNNTGHPAKRVYQALRIEVNRELDGLDKTVYDIVSVLKPKGRLAVITFHSLEDRIIKHAFKELEIDCICDKSIPICICDKKREAKIITKKPIVSSDVELAENSRSKSAKLRIIEKI